uniref:Uncharacterized protein n=1 Tax=Zea mays TaxID=4577 RepID=B6TM51_MAIZE|nr:hypothetical protein [Zea mays]ACG39111.1 hypothetical protein [Zea mays]
MGRGGGMGNPVNVGIAVQADWENREFISNISLNVRRPSFFHPWCRFFLRGCLAYRRPPLQRIAAP